MKKTTILLTILLTKMLNVCSGNMSSFYVNKISVSDFTYIMNKQPTTVSIFVQNLISIIFNNTIQSSKKNTPSLGIDNLDVKETHLIVNARLKVVGFRNQYSYLDINRRLKL